MECKDILNLTAIIVIPIAAVLIGQCLQSRSEKRKDKMHNINCWKQWQEQSASQQAYNTLLNAMANIVPKEQKNTEGQE